MRKGGGKDQEFQVLKFFIAIAQAPDHGGQVFFWKREEVHLNAERQFLEDLRTFESLDF